jgi:hypothetical protein
VGQQLELVEGRNRNEPPLCGWQQTSLSGTHVALPWGKEYFSCFEVNNMHNVQDLIDLASVHSCFRNAIGYRSFF